MITRDHIVRLTLPAILFTLVLACADSRPLHAQERPSLAAQPAGVGSITVDGRLDEAAWAQAPAAPGFLQFEPTEGAPASQRSEVRLLYGASALYVAAVLHDSEPAAVEPRLGRRDEFNRADWFAVSIDSYLDRRTAYLFAVNAAGVQLDGIVGGSGNAGGLNGDPDTSWDAIWSSAVRVTAGGWVAEIAIPYSMLRFPRADVQTWGVQLARYIPRLRELSEWPLVPRAQRTNQVARFADLTGIRGIEPRRNVQLQPYSVARAERHESLERPGRADGRGELDAGGDIKIGLGPNVTLDATVNPDFGQVEADPAVLNLTAFETVFEERRPFFVEGSQIYQFSAGPGRLLYTRRIGAGEPIIGATKLSGRTGGGLSFGVLGASTGDDFRPQRHYGVARMTQQLGRYSSAGGILTLYDALAEPGRARSVVAGADADLRFLDNRYGIESFAAVTNRSWTSGEPTERGFAGKLWGVKRQGEWQGFVGLDMFGDGFDPNDVGQMPFDNTIVLLSSVEHQVNGNRPFGPFQRANASLFALQRWSFRERLDQGIDLNVGYRGVLRGFQTIEVDVGIERAFGGYDLFETRGEGPWSAPATLGVNVEYGTDERRSWRVEPEVGIGFQRGGGRGYSAGLRGNWSVSDRLSFEGNVEGEVQTGVVAWSSNETFLLGSSGWSIGRLSGRRTSDDPGDYFAFDDPDGTLSRILAGVAPFAPDRYLVPVFGARDTRSTDLTLRGTYTFTPNLSFQLYSQLFLAKGRYRDMGILRTPDEVASLPSFPKRDEFAFSRLQSNAVLRWQYRPGSTMYVVWTHGRGAEDELAPLGPWGASPYARSLGGQIGETFGVFPDDVVLVKISYAFLN